LEHAVFSLDVNPVPLSIVEIVLLLVIIPARFFRIPLAPADQPACSRAGPVACPPVHM